MRRLCSAQIDAMGMSLMERRSRKYGVTSGVSFYVHTPYIDNPFNDTRLRPCFQVFNKNLNYLPYYQITVLLESSIPRSRRKTGHGVLDLK